MAMLHVTNRGGKTHTIEGEVGISLMENLRNAGMDEIQALCGGTCSCATCHVHVDAAFLDRLPTMEPPEQDLLEAADHRIARSRLSCQIIFTEELDGLRVTIPPE